MRVNAPWHIESKVMKERERHAVVRYSHALHNDIIATINRLSVYNGVCEFEYTHTNILASFIHK